MDSDLTTARQASRAGAVVSIAAGSPALASLPACRSPLTADRGQRSHCYTATSQTLASSGLQVTASNRKYLRMYNVLSMENLYITSYGFIYFTENHIEYWLIQDETDDFETQPGFCSQ